MTDNPFTPYRRREEIPAEARRLLARHVTNLDANIYCIQNLPPEVVAVLFAYVSRSPKSFRENLLALLDSGDLQAGSQAGGASSSEERRDESAADYERAAAKAKAFHEKWVVGYGHASVAEHADIKYAVDDVSIHAAKFLENNRLGSYTEKSSRYQVFDRNSFVVPPELDADEAGAGRLRALYVDACVGLFETYQAAIEPLTAHMERAFPLGEGKSPRAWQASLKAKVCDVARYLLPAGTMTSLGISWNARAAEHAINKMLSAPSRELRAIGLTMLEEGRKICPALLKHVGEKSYLRETPARLGDLAREAFAAAPPTPLAVNDDFPWSQVSVVEDTPDAEGLLLAALLFEGSGRAWSECRTRAAALDEAGRDALLSAFFDGRENFDWPLRALEHPALTMEMVMDYGAYRDVQRHRIATLTEQTTTCELGFDTPPEFESVGLGERYRAAMEAAAAAHARLRDELPAIAPYVVPQGFRKRVLFTWNLRELEHFIRLRSGRAGHASYRRVAQLAHRRLRERHPRLARYFVCDHDDYGLGRLAAEERTEAKRLAAAAYSQAG